MSLSSLFGRKTDSGSGTDSSSPGSLALQILPVFVASLWVLLSFLTTLLHLLPVDTKYTVTLLSSRHFSHFSYRSFLSSHLSFKFLVSLLLTGNPFVYCFANTAVDSFCLYHLPGFQVWRIQFLFHSFLRSKFTFKTRCLNVSVMVLGVSQRQMDKVSSTRNRKSFPFVSICILHQFTLLYSIFLGLCLTRKVMYSFSLPIILIPLLAIV